VVIEETRTERKTAMPLPPEVVTLPRGGCADSPDCLASADAVGIAERFKWAGSVVDFKQAEDDNFTACERSESTLTRASRE
jgi:hypothetical protein